MYPGLRNLALNHDMSDSILRLALSLSYIIIRLNNHDSRDDTIKWLLFLSTLPLKWFHGACPGLGLGWKLGPISWIFSSLAYNEKCLLFILNHRVYSKFTNYNVSVRSLSRVRLFATPWIAAHQPSLSITNSQSSLKLTSIESVMPSSHLILGRPLLLLPPMPPSIRVFSNESTLHVR